MYMYGLKLCHYCHKFCKRKNVTWKMYSLKQETTEQGQKFDPPPEVVKLTLEVTCKIS